MSKPISFSKPPMAAVRTMPTTPPAGPEKNGILALEQPRVG